MTEDQDPKNTPNQRRRRELRKGTDSYIHSSVSPKSRVSQTTPTTSVITIVRVKFTLASFGDTHVCVGV
eukprot:m.45462 g.45462  ORF g.45462 m.45462 type:complete len:69 (+) comp19971_c0_seq1:154-360(+)